VSYDASDGRQIEVGEAGSSVLVDQYVCLCRYSGCKYEDISFGGSETHPFQISVYHAEVMHVLQPVCNAGQLNGKSVMVPRDQVITYKLGAVDVLVPLDKLVDISVFHPLGNQGEPVFIQCHPKQR